ncbi:MAG TPA: nuclear transport factor 2 family protein [Bauldia sp.]
MIANAETRWAVIQAVDALLDHIANGRHRESIASFTCDGDGALIGSEASEWAIGPEGLRGFFASLYAQPYRVLFKLDDRRISAAGNVAWFSGEGTYRLSSGDEDKPYRLVGVLERREGRWLWQLFSGSEPV